MSIEHQRALFHSTKQFRTYRYKVEAMQFVIPGQEIIDLPSERMIGFSIENDFEANAFPLFRVSIAMEASRYYKIMAAKDTGYLYLRVDMYYMHLDDSTKSMNYACINDNFDMILDDATDDMLIGQKRKEFEQDFTATKRSDINNLKDTENAILTTYLFKSDVVTGTKQNIGCVLEKATVADALGYCFTKSGIKNVVMTRPENTQVYPEFVIPQMSIMQAIPFIDTYYGIYQQGSMLFYGLNYSYLIPYSGICRAYVDPKNAFVSIFVPNSENEHASASGVLETGTVNALQIFLVADYHSLHIDTSNVSNDLTRGNDITLINGFDGSSTQTQSMATGRNDVNVSRIQEDNTENPFLATMYTAQTNALATVIKLRIMNADITPFEPNRQYNVVFEDSEYATKYAGNYIISGVLHEFTRDGIDYSVSTTVTLKRSIDRLPTG